MLKPINIDELQRIHLKILNNKSHQFKETDEKIEIKISSKHYIFKSNEITHISSEGNYTTIYSTNSKPLMVSKNLKKVKEAYFKNLPFFRCHQSHIININQVSEYSNYEILLKNGKTIPLSNKRYFDFILISKNGY